MSGNSRLNWIPLNKEPTCDISHSRPFETRLVSSQGREREAKYAASAGGTLSAEHGVGKLKRDYLRLFYTDDELRAMATIKKALDPNGILGRGNIFSEELL